MSKEGCARLAVVEINSSASGNSQHRLFTCLIERRKLRKKEEE
jgi:hypothetical protein